MPYSEGRVKPFINRDDPVDRQVGRRLAAPDLLSVTSSRIADSVASRIAFGGVRIPRGVHRFRTHEEAEAWLWQMMTRPRQA